MLVTLLGIFTHVNHLLIKAAGPILKTLCPPIVDGITIFFGPFISSYHVIVPLLLSKVKYDSSVGFIEQELHSEPPPEPDPPPLPLLPPFIPKSAFSSKVPLLRALSDPVEISVDTYSSAHCDPTTISRVFASLKDISLLPVPVTPF